MKKLTVTMHRAEVILGLIYIALQIFVLPVILVIINEHISQPLSYAALNFLNFAINFTCVTVIFHRYLIISFKVAVQKPGDILSIALKGFGLYWLSGIFVNILVLFLDPEFTNVNDENIAILADQNSLLIAIGTVILVPVVEETLYRGVVFGQLYRKSPVIAYIVSTIVFSSLHVLGYIGMYAPLRLFLCLIQYFPAAIILAWTYTKSNTIWTPILIHTVINLIGMLAMQ